ncbi:MAG: hypothetical protein ACK5CW_08225 [Verrucomicrobiota bacterium]
MPVTLILMHQRCHRPAIIGSCTAQFPLRLHSRRTFRSTARPLDSLNPLHRRRPAPSRPLTPFQRQSSRPLLSATILPGATPIA